MRNLTGLAGQIQSMTVFKYLIQRAFIIQPAEESILMAQRINSMNWRLSQISSRRLHYADSAMTDLN